MQAIQFNVQTITPLFMAGASQDTAELRVPSFRGEMRYWYRALAGGIVGTDAEGLQQVKALEKKVFGTTDHGSAVAIHLFNVSKTPIGFSERFSDRMDGKKYLLWSMASTKTRSARSYFPPSTSFNLELSTRGMEETGLQQATAAFWLLANLGGVGSRSRRCAGSLSAQVAQPAQKTFGNVATDLSFRPVANVAALKQHLERGIATARSVIKPENGQRPVHEAHFDALSKETCRIWILQDHDGYPWNSVDEAMRDIGTTLQEYRGGMKLEDRAIFGLPLKDVSDTKTRRASPLLLRITQLQGNKYVGVAVLFKTFYSRLRMDDYDYFISYWAEEFKLESLEVTL